MLVNFVTKGRNVNLDALTSLPDGLEVGQMGLLTNLDTAVASIAPGSKLSIPAPALILQGGGKILLFWDGSKWQAINPVPQYLFAQSSEVDDGLVAANRVTGYLDEDGDDLILKVKYSDGTVATAAIAVTPDA